MNAYSTGERATLMQKLSALSYDEKAAVISRLNTVESLSQEDRSAAVDIIIKEIINARPGRQPREK